MDAIDLQAEAAERDDAEHYEQICEQNERLHGLPPDAKFEVTHYFSDDVELDFEAVSG